MELSGGNSPGGKLPRTVNYWSSNLFDGGWAGGGLLAFALQGIFLTRISISIVTFSNQRGRGGNCSPQTKFEMIMHTAFRKLFCSYK